MAGLSRHALVGRLAGRATAVAFIALVLIGCSPSLTIAPDQLPDAGVGEPYSQTITAQISDGSQVHGMHTGGELPPGLTFRYHTDVRQAEISGAPTTPGTYTFKVYAYGPQYMFSGADGERDYTLVVR